MRRWVILAIATVVVVACRAAPGPPMRAPARDAPFPATWTPTALVQETPTATRVVWPTPTWDGTPPPPSLDALPRMPPARLDRALRGDTPDGLEAGVTVVDVRSLAAYEQAHLPGALHIPAQTLTDRTQELDGNQAIVVYALSGGEGEDLQAAMVLYELGFTRVAVLDGGIQRWYAEGYLIEGTWLTPTPDELGPPWTLTPFSTVTEEPDAQATDREAETATPTPTDGSGPSDTPAPSATITLTPNR